jgi:lactoylglutathione lyase
MKIKFFLIFLFVYLINLNKIYLQVPATHGLNHVALSVKDLTASAKFYHEILGFEPVEVPKSMFGIRFWFQIAPGQQLHLLNNRQEMVTNNHREAGHFSISIDSADEWEVFLRSKNCQFHRQQRVDKAWQIYLTDPDGYVIELNEPKI